MTVLRCTISRALRAAWRACAARMTFCTMVLASFGMLLEVIGEHAAHGLGYGLGHLLVAELGLGLAFELGLHDLDADDGGEAFAEVVSADVELELVEHARCVGILLQGVGQSTAEAAEVGAAFVGVDVVDVAVEALVERGVVDHRHFDRDVVYFSFDVDDVLR